MSQTNSKFQLPSNLLDNEDVVLYRHETDLIDKAFDENFYSEINKLKNIYNPVSEFYDPDYIMDLLGATTLKNLLSTVTDKVSLTMILGGIYNIKGTKTAFETILKIIKLNYKQIIYKQLPNGCTEVTIIVDQGVRLDISDIRDLIRFSKEVFPLCLTLAGVTNCIVYSDSANYSGYTQIALGQHVLDRNFVLDLSKLDTTFGANITTPDGSLNVLICNPTYADQDLNTQYAAEAVSIRNLYSTFRYSLSALQRLDYEYVLDTQINNNYYFFSTAHGTLKNHDMVYTGFSSSRFGTSQNISQFRLDRDSLDRTMLRRLDGVQAYTIKKGLDYSLNTDRIPTLDANATPLIIHNTSITQRNIATDGNMIVTPSAISAQTHQTSPDANHIITLNATDDRIVKLPNTTLIGTSTVSTTLRYADLKLVFNNSADSQYLPALII